MSEETSYGNISSDAVEKATGRNWESWFQILDDARASKLSHAEIARWLGETHIESGWWCQAVTVGYEQARGLREKHQQSGGFSVSVSKTIPVPVPQAYAAWVDDAARSDWLPDSTEIEFTTANLNKNLRCTWPPDDSRLVVSFNPRANDRCQVVVQCERLPGAESVEPTRSFWKDALARLESRLTAG